MTYGKKLNLCLSFMARGSLNLLPEGSRSIREFPGWAGSAMILEALFRARESWRSSREGRLHPITLSAERMTRCSLALSFTVEYGNQMMIEVVRMDSMMAV